MSTIYATASHHRPPTAKYKGRHRRTRTKRTKGTVVTLTALLAAAFTLGCAGAATPDAAPLDDSPATTSAAAPKAKTAGLGDGIYKVGSEVKPGSYTTTVPADANCYWSRVSSFDGELDSIVANGNLDAGAHGRITVKKSDAGLTLVGGCTWVVAK